MLEAAYSPTFLPALLLFTSALLLPFTSSVMTVKTYALGGLFAGFLAGFAFDRECLVAPCSLPQS